MIKTITKAYCDKCRKEITESDEWYPVFFSYNEMRQPTEKHVCKECIKGIKEALTFVDWEDNNEGNTEL